MRIGFAGVAHSHPFSDAANAQTLGVSDFAVWDADDPGRRADFIARTSATACSSLEELLERKPDLVIVTVRPERTVDVVDTVLSRNVPCFLNKVAAASEPALQSLDAVVRRHNGTFFTSSVLRFAPAMIELRRQVSRSEVLAIHASVRHGIDVFTTAARRWQDDPLAGGGTAISMGLHGWEMLDVVLDEDITVHSGSTRTLPDSSTVSENIAVFEGSSGGGVPVTMEVVGAGQTEAYEVVVHTRDDVLRARLDEDLGYVACLRAAMAMASGGPAPVAWPRSHRVLRTTVRAAAVARAASGTTR